MTRRSAPPPRPRPAKPAPPRRSAPPPPRRASKTARPAPPVRSPKAAAPKAAAPKAAAPKAAAPKAAAPKAAAPKAAAPKAAAPKAAAPKAAAPKAHPSSAPVPRAAAPKARRHPAQKADNSTTQASPVAASGLPPKSCRELEEAATVSTLHDEVAGTADQEMRKHRAAEARDRVEQAKQVKPRRAPRLELHPGDTVAQRYVVKRVLGRSRGLLLEANHAHFQQRLALRIISTAYATDAKAVQRFHRETRILSQLESEHVARIADAGTLEDGSIFLAREYLEGESFEAIGKRGLSVAEAVDLFLQVCEAVQEAHARGVVLRDLQPSHVFVTRKRNGEPVAKITDFGTCKVMRDPAAAAEGSCTRLMGLSPSASPELIRQQSDIDQRADVWSLGCMLYALLTGHAAFSGDGTALMLSIAQDEPLPPSSLRRDVDIPQGVDRAVFGALSKRRGDRPARVFDLALALGPYASARGQVHLEQIARLAGEALEPYRAPEDSLDDSMTMVRNLRHSEPGPAPSSSIPSAVKAGPMPVPVPPSSSPSVPPMRAAASSAPVLPAQRPSLPPMAPLPSYPQVSRPRRRGKLALALVPLAAAAVAIFATVALTPGETLRAQAAVPRFSLPMTPGADEEPTIAAESADDLQDAPPAEEKPETEPAPAAETTPAVAAPPTPSHSRFLDARQAKRAKRSRRAEPKKADVSSAPKAAPGEKGTLVAMAIGASCAFTVDGAGLGTRSSVRKKVSAGAHTVSCTKVGGTTRTRTVNVTPGKAAVAVFKF